MGDGRGYEVPGMSPGEFYDNILDRTGWDFLENGIAPTGPFEDESGSILMIYNFEGVNFYLGVNKCDLPHITVPESYFENNSPVGRSELSRLQKLTGVANIDQAVEATR